MIRGVNCPGERIRDQGILLSLVGQAAFFEISREHCLYAFIHNPSYFTLVSLTTTTYILVQNHSADMNLVKAFTDDLH